MKSGKKRRKLSAFLMSLVLCLSLLPLPAFAYNEGEISGTSGSGATEDDPVACYTLEAFQAAMQNEEIAYVKIKRLVVNLPPITDYRHAIAESHGKKTLIVEGGKCLQRSAEQPV